MPDIFNVVKYRITNKLLKEEKWSDARKLIMEEFGKIFNSTRMVQKGGKSTEPSILKKIVPENFHHPDNWELADAYAHPHNGGKDAVNIHSVALDANENIWTAGCWYILLPNIMLTMSEVDQLHYGLRPAVGDTVAWGKQKVGVFDSRFIGVCAVIRESTLSEKSYIAALHNILYSMRHLFNVFIIAKRFGELEPASSEGLVLDALANAMVPLISATFLDTYASFFHREERVICCNQDDFKANFNHICGVIESFVGSSTLSALENKPDSYANRVVISLLKSILAVDFQRYGETLGVKPVQDPSPFESLMISNSAQLDRERQVILAKKSAEKAKAEAARAAARDATREAAAVPSNASSLGLWGGGASANGGANRERPAASPGSDGQVAGGQGSEEKDCPPGNKKPR